MLLCDIIFIRDLFNFCHRETDTVKMKLNTV